MPLVHDDIHFQERHAMYLVDKAIRTTKYVDRGHLMCRLR